MSGHGPFAALTLDRKRLGDETAPADQRTEYGENAGTRLLLETCP